MIGVNKGTGGGGRRRTGEAVVTDGELLDYLDGLADRAASRRVVTAALRDGTVRARLKALRELDRAAVAFADAHEAADTAAAEHRLGAAMRLSVQEYARPGAAAATPREPALAELDDLVRAGATGGGRARGGLWRGAARSADALQVCLEQIGGAVSRALVTGRQALSLPCLAPATAASPADLQLRRETVTTADGVRIEFQQLPGAGPGRLRVFVDASLIAGEIRDLGYNVAFLTLEDGGGQGAAAAPERDGVGGPAPDRHILVIALNVDGRGFTDFIVGGAVTASPSMLPSPRGVCRLTGLTLSHVATAG